MARNVGGQLLALGWWQEFGQCYFGVAGSQA
jgi:hypothetical protein